MRVLWLSFVLVAVPAFVQAEACPVQAGTCYVPLDQVRPGMKGYGCTVLDGLERSRFDVTVRNIIPHYGEWPAAILVQLHGGPNNIMEQHQIFHGMSGSPLYNEDGCIISGLAIAKGFATTSKTLTTPIQFQFEMARMLQGTANGSSAAQPGDYVATCLVYGDDQGCFSSTVTAKQGGILYTTSHGVGMPVGPIALPVFIVPVADLLEAQDGTAVKLPGPLGIPVGTAAVHGRFGILVREGALPTTIPIHYTLEGVRGASGARTSFLAYHAQAPKTFREQCGNYLQQFVQENASSHLEVTIIVDSLHATIHFSDTFDTGLDSLAEMLNALITQEGPALIISSIDMRFTVLPTEELRFPLAIQTSGKNERGMVTVLAQQTKDQAISQVSEPLDLRPIKPYRKKEPVWMDGAKVQAKILQRMSVRQALSLLERTQEHEGLYLVWSESDEDIKLNPSGSGWQGHVPQIRILASTTMSGSRFFLPPATKSLPYVHK